MISILFLSLGLAVDCFAVSLASGAYLKKVKITQALKIALYFGGFQAGMALLGWIIGSGLHQWMILFDHWFAFGLLSLVGGKMIYEGLSIHPEEEKQWDPLNIKTLLILAFATSIDALAVGFSVFFTTTSLFTVLFCIGGVSFALSLLGAFLGEKFGHFFENRIEIAGGIILIGIGIKILLEHLYSVSIF
jgi:putative Mn2+ efflux pump MntP